jgi:hypothetical protein
MCLIQNGYQRELFDLKKSVNGNTERETAIVNIILILI